MATKIWQGGGQAVAQVNTATPASVGIGDVFTVTINGKSVSYVAAAATVADVTAGLVAAVSASTEPEFTEVAATDSTTHVTLTAVVPGKPFVQTSGATGGTATLTTATPTASSGPNNWDVAANWDTGTVPVDTDDVIVDGPTPDILYGLAQTTVALASLTITAGYTGSIGLPDRADTGYSEYRETYLRLESIGTLNVGTGQGAGSGRLKIDTGTAAVPTVNVVSTGSGVDQGVPALLVKGTPANAVVNVVTGSVGLAVLPGETATVLTLRVGGGSGGQTADVRCGAGLTLTTLEQAGGDVALAAAVTTVRKTDGTLTITGSGAVTTLNNDGGELFFQGTGTTTTLTVSAGGTADYSRDPRPRTVTTCTLSAGAALRDPFRTVTWTNPVILSRCALTDVAVDLGTHLQLAPSAGP